MIAHTTLGFMLAQGVGATMHGARLGALLGASRCGWCCSTAAPSRSTAPSTTTRATLAISTSRRRRPRTSRCSRFALMVAGQGIALALPRGFAIAYAICFAMSLLYSVPPARLKAVAGADWIINMIGFGTLTPYAGWALYAAPAHARRCVGARRIRAALRRAVSAHAAVSARAGSRARRSHARHRARGAQESRRLDRRGRDRLRVLRELAASHVVSRARRRCSRSAWPAAPGCSCSFRGSCAHHSARPPRTSAGCTRPWERGRSPTWRCCSPFR